MILGFDTATPATAVAVLRDDGRTYERYREPAPGERPRHTRDLLVLATEVLDEAGVGWGELGRIAVGIGPGSFTGLRIAVATARGLAQSRGLDLAGVSTLRTLAAAAEDCADGRPVLALLDAGRGELFAGAWQRGQRVLAQLALPPDAVADTVARLAGTPLAVGNGSVRLREMLEAAATAVPADDSPLHRVSAGQLCRLAARAPAVARDALRPDYLRDPDAKPRDPAAR